MATAGGPDIERDGLVFAIDSDSNVRGYTKYGTSGTNNNHRAIKNLVDRSSTFSMANTSQLTGGVTYYTLYGITYPEGSYSPANRDGITVGFDNISSGKLYSASRDVNYYVFDEDTNTWISDSYFNGERINGHCYDTYDGEPAQHATFQSDFDTISTTFPNATHIIIGSHASENVDNNADTVIRLKKIGLPDDAVGLGRVEFVLVGKVDKPWTHHYVRENVSSAVANMVIGLPLEGKGGALTFDGTDDYMEISLTGINLDSSCTIEGVLKRNSTPTAWRTFFNIKPSSATTPFFEFRSNANSQYIYADYYSGTDYTTNAASFPTGNYGHAVATYDGAGNINMYFNGELIHTKTGVPSFTIGTSPKLTVGRAYSNDRYTDIEAPVVKVYNRALSTQEVQQNYNAYKKRFNL